MVIKAIIALSALMLALAPAILNQVYAFPGENGQGHQKQTECDHGPSGQDCPGNSENADDHEECTTTFAGNSQHVKDTSCS